MNRICFEMNFSELRATFKHTICMYYIAHIQFTRNSSKLITAIIHMISKLSRRNINLWSNTNSLIYIRQSFLHIPAIISTNYTNRNIAFDFPSFINSRFDISHNVFFSKLMLCSNIIKSNSITNGRRESSIENNI